MASSSYRNTLGGKLQLKGDLLPSNKPIKKKKKKKKITLPPEEELGKFADYKEAPPAEEQGDVALKVENRTPAEIAFEKAQQRRLGDKAKQMSAKSHREKIEEFNKRLANMSEHYDIPKVGPG